MTTAVKHPPSAVRPPSKGPRHPAAPSSDDGCPTLWGLSPTQLHDRFWAARGVQVIRQGDASEIITDAELFLLTDSHSLTVFKLGQLLNTLNWLRPRMMFVRLRSVREHGYQERIIADEQGRFERFERVYGGSESGVARAALTAEPELARRWQSSTGSPAAGWRDLRRSIARTQRTAVTLDGDIYDRDHSPDLMRFMRKLVQVWRRPDATIPRARGLSDHAWADVQTPSCDVRFIGPVWIGAGRNLEPVDSVVGPAVLWDDPETRPAADGVPWHELEPAPETLLPRPVLIRRLNRAHRLGKRLFDIAFALLGIAITIPVYPLVFLAILIEDGPPFFFAHPRQTLGGREFGCLKFRTMKKNAEHLKQELAEKNQADGPQFFIENDPRLTRVGKIMRKLNLDELPQFFNVLAGQMAVVGPRPSPHNENQFCPSWREARLSVRPGVTGLWQIMRSRREGEDFQEWIKYDIQYVENIRWRYDLWIIWRTILKILGR